MSVTEPAPIRLHEDPVLFREAVNYTAAETGFMARLVEKDYFCSVVLQHLAGASDELTFRGGTCLAKVHAEFYRLSEDLDFVIPTDVDASRGERSRRAAQSKRAVGNVGMHVPGLSVITQPTGANDSMQYNAVLGYESVLGPHEETIKIEVALREHLLEPPINGEVQTLLLNPISDSPMIPPFSLACLSQQEAMAEKLRAALSRRGVAIRDFYDVDYAVRQLNVSVLEPELVALVRRKLAVPGNDPPDVSEVRLAALRPQLESQLKAVLRPSDFAKFDLERAFATVAGVAAAMG